MTVLLKPQPLIEEIIYPESDGKPMAESDLHREMMFYIIHLLQRFFRGQQVYVSGNMLVYWVEGKPAKSVAPDCFVVRGVEPRKRSIYQIWNEGGKGPEVVFEVSSKTTHREDLTKKFTIYGQIGVQEYYIYDPTSDYLEPPLLAYEWKPGQGYIAMEPIKEELEWNGLTGHFTVHEAPEYESKILGLRLTLDKDDELVFYNAETGERLLTDGEARERAEIRAQQAEGRAEQAEGRAEQAEGRATKAEAENTRLLEELARLRGDET